MPMHWLALLMRWLALLMRQLALLMYQLELLMHWLAVFMHFPALKTLRFYAKLYLEDYFAQIETVVLE